MQTFKSASEFREKIPISSTSSLVISLKLLTLVLLTSIGFFGAIILFWLLGNSHASELFAQLHLMQENPPNWLKAPQWDNQYYLLAPTITLFLLAQIITKLSPQPQTWSRVIIISTLLLLTTRYLLWRLLSTLNLVKPADGIFSLVLLLMEMLAMAGGIIQLCLMFNIKDRHREADLYSRAVIEGNYTPSVDILIPTYNEPDFILKRTIIGCQALDYPHKQVYLLDDTRRPEIKQLAQQLGCHYFTRSDNSHAKAGNLNHALTKTSGELIVVFDADFVPTINFLTRTVGFFQNKKIALVQTPQSFYNSDPIARNLGLENILTAEEEVFYRQVQPIKDGVGSVVCAGTSFVVRRSALEEVGYFVTESLSEDYFTGIRLAARGYELVYLDEKLSAGLAAESISAHIDQRLRWIRGTLQAFFIESNPLTIPGLSLWQRLGHLEGLLHWFASVPRAFFLFVPLIYIFFDIKPIRVDLLDVVYIILPYYTVWLTVFSWLNLRSRSAILSDLYSLVQCFPLALTLFKVIFNPFSRGFKVTPKGLARKQSHFNWTLAFPLTILLATTLISFSLCLLNFSPKHFLTLGSIWSGYNLVMISVALLTLVDLPKPSFYEWFPQCKQVKIVSGDRIYSGFMEKLAEEGAEICLSSLADLSTTLTLDLLEDGLNLRGYITHAYFQDTNTRVRIKFHDLSLAQQRKLIEILYCRPGQWQRRMTPGEWQSLWLLFKVLLRPLKLFRSKWFLSPLNRVTPIR
ncbi:glycosyltransferase [Pleurocapsales cyanobacterium LEGE 06147]|nr:glycosyltransferase [Pleurocapsales cyanobacterium LEGE 06147]